MMRILSCCCYGHLQWDLTPTKAILLLLTTASLHLPQLATLVPFFMNILTMEAHVNSVCRPSFSHLHNISSIRRVLDMKTAVIIVQALVISRLHYCNSLLCGLPAIQRLQRVQNAAARVIAEAGRRNHISQILIKLDCMATGRILHKVQDPAIDISCYTWPRPNLHHRAASAPFATPMIFSLILKLTGYHPNNKEIINMPWREHKFH